MAAATRTRPLADSTAAALTQPPLVRCLVVRSLHRQGRHMATVRQPPRTSARAGVKQVRCSAQPADAPEPPLFITDDDLDLLIRTARLADTSAGLTQPHPNAACLLVDPHGMPITEAYLWAQGTESAESQAVSRAGEAARGSTAYLNLEPGDCHGEDGAVEALIRGGVSRVVLGMRHPMPHFRGAAVDALRRAGITVQVLGEDVYGGPNDALAAATLEACLAVNAPLLHRVVTKKPLGVLKYAMTLDGKIATAQGHSAWVSSPESRQRVFEVRARSDAVIVGGQTVRRDNPQLTTRREGGHQPARIVMSRTLDLPENANLWDVSRGATLVMTQRGARRPFQRALRARGVEVVEFDFLTPDAVARYCAERGYLQCLWECGGMLAAPAIAGGAIHRVMAFVAPKIIGGSRAPTPVGDLGFVEMTQALELQDPHWAPSGPDLLLTGYLPHSGGLRALATAAGVLPAVAPAGGMGDTGTGPILPGSSSGGGAVPAAAAAAVAAAPQAAATAVLAPPAPAAAAATAPQQHPAAPATQAVVVGNPCSKWVLAPPGALVAEFYKAWDRHGCLSNFSPHAITMPGGPMTVERLRQLLGGELPAGLLACGLQPAAAAAEGSEAISGPSSSSSSSGGGSSSSGGGSSSSGARSWPSVEHYYQSQKFEGVALPEAVALVEAIARAASPEEAAQLGRRTQFLHPELVRPDWDGSKVAVMYAALRAKFAVHAGPQRMLLSSARPAAGVHAAAANPVSIAAAGAVGAPAAAAAETPATQHAVAAAAQQQQQQHAAGAPCGGASAAEDTAGGVVLVESSPHDLFWGRGFDGSGANMLGRLLMVLRDELAREGPAHTLN